MKKNLFKYGMLLIIILFLGLYFIYSNGYYEKLQNDKMILTNNQIEQFEEDLKNGVDITLESYLDNDINYQTKTGGFSLKISNKVENIVDSTIKFIFRSLSNIVE